MARGKEVNYFIESNVAKMVTRICNQSDKSQAEISQEMGFWKPNVITMIKQGRINMPIGRIPAFCKATDSDANALLSAVLEQNHPEIVDVLAEVRGISLSKDELEFLKIRRTLKKAAEKEAGHTLSWKVDTKSMERLEKHLNTQLIASSDG
jgi:hypothetical protein